MFICVLCSSYTTFSPLVPTKIPHSANNFSCCAIKMLIILQGTLRHDMYTNDNDNQSGAAPWRRLGCNCSPLWALSKCRQRQTDTRCSGPESARWIFPYFPPLELRYVFVNPVKNHTGNEIALILVSLDSSSGRSGPVRSAPADWGWALGSAPHGVPLRERAGAVWTRREIRAWRSGWLCSRGGSQSEASAGQVGGLFTCAARVTDGGQRRADRERHSRVSSQAAMWLCLFITEKTPRHSCGSVDLLDSNI